MANRRRRKRRQGIGGGTIFLLVLLILMIVVLGGGIGVMMHFQRTPGFLKNTTFMGEDIEGKTPEDILKRVMDQAEAVDVTLTEEGEPALSGKLADFGYTLDEETARRSLEDAMADQKNDMITVLYCLTGEETQVRAQIAWDFDEAVFKNMVQTSNLPIPRVQSTDAEVVENKEERRMELINEVYGNEFDEEELRSWVKEQIQAGLDSGAGQIAMTFPEELYIQPEVTAAMPGYADRVQALNTVAGAEVTYTFGSQTQVLDYETILSWVDVDGSQGTINQAKMEEYVTDIAAKYNTRHRPRTFTTTYGDTVKFSEDKNDYGYRVNVEGELEQLAADLVSGAPVEREPVYYKTNKWDNPYYLKRDGVDDLAGTYVEVSLEDQHVWFYKDGELVIETDCVSGDVKKNRETATGCFPLAYKKSPEVLTGGNGNGSYATEVTYWMPFYEGQGLHDATWRSNFGGSIYKSNGSHGCVNLPKKAAQVIYENISAGTAIIIY